MKDKELRRDFEGFKITVDDKFMEMARVIKACSRKIRLLDDKINALLEYQNLSADRQSYIYEEIIHKPFYSAILGHVDLPPFKKERIGKKYIIKKSNKLKK